MSKIINVGKIKVEFRRGTLNGWYMYIERFGAIGWLSAYVPGWSKDQCIKNLEIQLENKGYKGEIVEVEKIYAEEKEETTDIKDNKEIAKAIDKAYDYANLKSEDDDCIYTAINRYKALRELNQEQKDKVYDIIGKRLGFMSY